jgi:hypothetical protein
MNVCRQLLYSPLYVNQQMLEFSLRNSSIHVNKTYLLCSHSTWNISDYNWEYDISFINRMQSTYRCEFIFGDWPNEHAMRNTGIEIAKNDGFDWLIIQDADEFINDETYHNIKLNMLLHPNVHGLKLPMITFWKDWEHVLVDDHNNPAVFNALMAVNLSTDSHFVDNRNPNDHLQYFTLITDSPVFHGSYVLTNEELQRKLSSWGHAKDFDTDAWYNNIWIKWNYDTSLENLHPTHPSIWRRAIKLDFKDKPYVLCNI